MILAWMRSHWRRLLGALAVLMVGALTINTVVTRNETAPARADIGQIVTLSGPDLQVREDGPADGDTILLLHGTPGSIRWWDRVTPILARKHHVVRVDLVGHGGSAKPTDGYDLPDQARQLGLVLDRLGVTKTLVVGYSFGGVVAPALVEQRRDLVSGVVVIGAPANSGDLKSTVITQAAEWPVVGELMNRLATESLIRAGLEPAFDDDTEVPDAFVDDVEEMTFTSFSASRDAGRAFLDQEPSDQRLNESGIPVAAIAGSEDEFVDPGALEQWGELPRSSTHLVDGGSHTLIWDRPQLVAEWILAAAAKTDRR